MKKSLLAIVGVLLFIGESSAQKQGNIWYFGKNAGMTFASGSPVAINNGKMDNLEGVASICDTGGNLLFYTDGQTVYNAQHNVMQDGTALEGHNSSTQSGVIVPVPQNPNRFYIFTVDEEGGPLKYSVVDMRGGGGLGRVITKNQQLLSASTEKITAVLASNETDVFVLAHGFGDNKYYIWRVSGAGLKTTPTVQTIGSTHGNNNNVGETKGYMKASPDGRKIAVAVNGEIYRAGFRERVRNGFVEVLDFDNTNGVLSNVIRLDDSNKPSGIDDYSDSYGVEFSPNSRFLYVSGWGVRGGSDDIIQIDLKAGNASAIAASAYEVQEGSGSAYGGMQLAVDGRIYITRNNSRTVSMIERPNCPRADCKYVNNALQLSSGTNGRMGLPTFIQSYFRKADFEFGDPSAPGTAKGLCFNDSMHFWIPDSSGLDSAVWNFGDPSSGNSNFAKGYKTRHVYTKSGVYTATMIVYRGNSTSCFASVDTIRRQVTVFPYPQFNLGNDTFFCAGNSIDLRAPNINESTIMWRSGASGTFETVNTDGWQWLDVTVDGCTSRDSIYVSAISRPVIDLPRDTFTCNGNSINLQVQADDSVRWIWSNGSDTGRSIILSNADQYLIYAYNRNCMSFDTVDVKNYGVPQFNLGVDTMLCAGQVLNLPLYFTKDTFTYDWQDMSTDSFYSVSSAGTYHVRVRGYGCERSDTIVVSYSSPKPFDLGADRVMCVGDSVRILASLGGNPSWSWSNSSTDSFIWAKTAGKFFVDASDGVCDYSDTINVSTKSLSSVNLPGDTLLCVGDSLKLNFNTVGNTEYRWNSTVYSNPLITLKNAGKYVLSMTDLPDRVCVLKDSFELNFQTPMPLSLGKDTLLCQGDQINVNATYSGVVQSSRWQDGQSGLSRQNNPANILHWLEVFDGICYIRDSVNVNYYPVVTVDLGPDRVLCEMDELDLDVQKAGLTQYDWWVDGVPSGNTSAFKVLNPGGEIVVRVGTDWCFASDTLQVDYFNKPVLDFGRDTTLCGNETMTLSMPAGLADQWVWTDGSSGADYVVDFEGLHGVWAANGPNGECAGGDTIQVWFTEAPDVDFGFTDTNLCDPAVFRYDFSLPHTNYYWQDGFSGPVRDLSAAGTYWVVAENACGRDSASFRIDIDEFGCRVDMPNAFSPNNDGINDVFRPSGNVYAYLTLEVFNRYGEKLHEGPAEKGWNGEYNGKLCQGGVYFYRLQYRKLINGYPRLNVINGTVTLVP